MVQNNNLERYNFAARLAKACNDRGIPLHGRSQYLADVAGVTNKAANKWVNGESLPGQQKAKKISSNLGVSFSWLLLGEGKGEKKEDLLRDTLTEKEITMLNLFNKMPESEQAKIIQQLTDKKEHYDVMFQELLKARGKAG
jgi:transcriptional regulator with XRE-family HTH domain